MGLASHKPFLIYCLPPPWTKQASMASLRSIGLHPLPTKDAATIAAAQVVTPCASQLRCISLPTTLSFTLHRFPRARIQAVDKDQNNNAAVQAEADVEALEARLGIGRRGRKDISNEPGTETRPKQPKDWESMTLAEKAWELYVGEKGVLFWLNKLAYASIFIVIGGWILFRFVGPALGWYQLESPLLPPNQVLGGSG